MQGFNAWRNFREFDVPRTSVNKGKKKGRGFSKLRLSLE
jgi:hypothetical protein